MYTGIREEEKDTEGTGRERGRMTEWRVLIMIPLQLREILERAFLVKNQE